MIKKLITSGHSYRITTIILDLQPHQSVRFLLQLLKNILLLLLEQKRVLILIRLTLHPYPTQSVFPICPPWTLKKNFQIPLMRPPLFYQHKHLTSQNKKLRQFQILYQETLPELNPLAC